MTERMVEIPIHREIRDHFKTIKGELSYNDFFVILLREAYGIEVTPFSKGKSYKLFYSKPRKNYKILPLVP